MTRREKTSTIGEKMGIMENTEPNHSWVISLLSLLMMTFTVKAQVSDSLSGFHLETGGYFKHLQTTVYQPLIGDVLMDGLMQNRLNLALSAPHSPFKFHAGLRTRMFYGNIFQLTPKKGVEIHRENNDFLPLSLNILDKKNILLNTYLDRLYGEWTHGSFEARIGRQRINWGIGNLWNPNDLFNTFNFTDFDYEERPGSDALRLTWYTGPVSRMEGVIQVAESAKDLTAAFLYGWSIGSFDFQAIAGKYRQDLTIGGGWSGYIDDVGFKGEWMYFRNIYGMKNSVFNLSAGIDYFLRNNIAVHGGYLYNESGSVKEDSDLFSFAMSAKNLYPWRHAVYMGTTYSFTPLFSGNITMVYSPVRSHPFFLSPNLSYNIATNWDMDLASQIFTSGKKSGILNTNIYAFFLRTKWSF